MPRASVIPELPYDDIRAAVSWLCEAFGFTLRLQIANHRAQMNAGDGAVVLVERDRDDRSAYSVMMRVENVDAQYERAVHHGAKGLRPPADYPYGERQSTVLDLAGHRWTFSQTIADIDPTEWGGTPGTL